MYQWPLSQCCTMNGLHAPTTTTVPAPRTAAWRICPRIVGSGETPRARSRLIVRVISCSRPPSTPTPIVVSRKYISIRAVAAGLSDCSAPLLAERNSEPDRANTPNPMASTGVGLLSNRRILIAVRPRPVLVDGTAPRRRPRTL